MSTKVKGLIKGLRYISQIFDEEKEAEIQIGFPTDVKHVAHIGWDGPSAVDNPTWMNEFKGAGALKSAPLGQPVDSKENPEIKWVSEDSKGRRGKSGSRDAAEGKKSSRRHLSCSDNDGGGDSPKSSKPRQSRRHKTAIEGSKPDAGPDPSLPDVPKKSRRKKSRDFNVDGSTRSSRTCKSSATTATAVTQDADQGEPSRRTIDDDDSLKPLAKVEEVENC
ncbi:unnamed protein product [Cuscuta epithymum]|uniref:CRIB domain-containing protein n=1 Tax=Cuscuta epithymum TaxID=186058 RepID=A0AAV0F1U0_9ASTE|nr:unnamed protein product [Cuscuta epithymum]